MIPVYFDVLTIFSNISNKLFLCICSCTRKFKQDDNFFLDNSFDVCNAFLFDKFALIHVFVHIETVGVNH